MEQLREDLSVDLRNCRLALCETINENYTDFIHLMEDFFGLDTYIINLTVPLESLLSDIKLVEKDFTCTLREITEKMEQLKLVRRKRKKMESIISVNRNLEQVQCLLDNIESQPVGLEFDMMIIERIAMQLEEAVVNLKFINSDCPSVFKLTSLESLSKDLSVKMRKIIEKVFNQAISRAEVGKIQRLYTIFLLNGQLDILEEMLIAKMRPHFVLVISESRLEALGADKFFNDIKNVLSSQINIFCNLETDCATWFISCIWNEVVTSLTLQSPSLFASGNPDQFHTNFTAAVKFLYSLKTALSREEKVTKYSQLHLLTRKFNIQVYFRIRFQEIASRFEYSLRQSYKYQPQEEPKFNIPPLIELRRSITDCWSIESIYLPPLFVNFWKLSLQLIARCTVWLSTIKLSDLFIENVTSIIESTRLKTSLVSTIFSQTEKMVTEIEKIYQEVILPLKPDNFDEKLLKESLDYGLIELARTGLPNIVKLTKECLANKNLT